MGNAGFQEISASSLQSGILKLTVIVTGDAVASVGEARVVRLASSMIGCYRAMDVGIFSKKN